MDKDKIRNIIELFIAWNGETEPIDVANIDSAVEFIDSSLQEKPVSEDLEEASKEWLSPQLDKSYAAYGETKQMELTHFDGYAMLDAIEFGANWQKQQDQSTIELAEDHAMLAGMEKMKEEMKAKAVETTFNVSLTSSLYDKLGIKGCKEGDKLLVIKKDEL